MTPGFPISFYFQHFSRSNTTEKLIPRLIGVIVIWRRTPFPVARGTIGPTIGVVLYQPPSGIDSTRSIPWQKLAFKLASTSHLHQSILRDGSEGNRRWLRGVVAGQGSDGCRIHETFRIPVLGHCSGESSALSMHRNQNLVDATAEGGH